MKNEVNKRDILSLCFSFIIFLFLFLFFPKKEASCLLTLKTRVEISGLEIRCIQTQEVFWTGFA